MVLLCMEKKWLINYVTCKVVIIKYVFCWLSFHAKFDCMLFNLLYPVFIVEFHCKGCVLERESVWRLKQLKTEKISRVACD